MDVFEAIKAERERVADDFEGLSEQQWKTPTLCTDWNAHEVVAHLAAGAEGNFAIGRFVIGLVRNGFNVNKMIATEAKQKAKEQHPAALVATLRARSSSRKLPPGLKPQAMLADVIIHGHDIARQLGMKREVPEEHVREAADFFKTMGFPFGTKKKIAGLTLRATDTEWSTGTGPEVRGPLESLLMVMAGRRAPLEDLDGDGKATLAARL